MPIYLDHAATTPLRREALDAMLPFLSERFGNPSSSHSFGRAARAALDDARDRIARSLGAEAREIVLTSGGTEALNLGLKGAAWAGKARGHRIVTTGVEHHAVGHTLQHLEKFGFEVVQVPVDRYGRVDPAEIEAAITDKTILVAVQLANNEVGTIQPVAEVVRRVHAHRGVLVAVDAVAAAPYLAIDVGALGCDLLAIAAHKFEGPKGAGALYVRHGTHILAQQHGGAQERYRRAGTEDVAGAVGMAIALELAVAEREATTRRLRRLRDRLVGTLVGASGVEGTGHPKDRLPGHSSIVVRDVDGAALVAALDLEGLAVSVGSACLTGSTEPSNVLTAMGYPADEARGALRMTLGRTTTDGEVDSTISIVPRVIAAQRAAVAVLAADPHARAAQGAGA